MHTNFAVAMMAGTVREVRYDNVQVLTEIEAVLQDLLSVMDEQLVDSLRSHPPYPPSEEGGNCRDSLRSHPPCPPSEEGGQRQSTHLKISRACKMCRLTC
jgi:hypothetical protein